MHLRQQSSGTPTNARRDRYRVNTMGKADGILVIQNDDSCNPADVINS